jgi:hypothetical protein
VSTRFEREHGKPKPPGSGLDRLRAVHPLWTVGAAWVSRASGPDARQVVARREGVTVVAWDETELSARIGEAERLHGWE